MGSYSQAKGIENTPSLSITKQQEPLTHLSPHLYFLLSFFSGPHLGHIEVSRLGTELKPQLLSYATATATWGPSLVCDLHHSSRQHQILNPLSEARDRT